MKQYQKQAEELMRQMSEEEKLSMLSGGSLFAMNGIERLGLPAYPTSDGPHGVKLLKMQDGVFGPVGKPTCLPTATALANSWNRELVRRMGRLLGKECQLVGTGVSLGPGVNLKRHPLCGRNFEYYSEDPYLAGELASEAVAGVQEEGVPVSVKHFAVNNQEYRRTTVDAQVDNRTLRELYLAVFERVVKKAKPASLMCSYNQINGMYAAENHWLLTEVLRDEWQYDGMVMSDWGAVHDRAQAVLAGLDLEMPGGREEGTRQVREALADGRLTWEAVETCVRRVVELILYIKDRKQPEGEIDAAAHHAAARELAGECMVLLKNEGQLPLPKGKPLSVIGDLAEQIRYQGGGSSMVMNEGYDSVVEEIRSRNGGEVLYARGYDSYIQETREDLVQEALRAAEQTERTVLVLGLPYGYESEEYDRYDMKLPANQLELVKRLAKVQKNLVVVFCGGSAVEMDWERYARGILYASLAGEGSGYAVASLLYGEQNPCGKLAETFPEKLAHTPAYLSYRESGVSPYQEGLYIGYRYYEKKEISPKYPFGFGLSYTTFTYRDLKLVLADGELTVSCTITNTGSRAGKEIVQLYLQDVASTVDRPVKELKGFEKCLLQPGESAKVTFRLHYRDFAYYEERVSGWHVENGVFRVLVGASSQDIRLEGSVQVTTDSVIPEKYTKETLIRDLRGDEKAYAKVCAVTETMPPANLPGYDHPVGPMGMDKRKQREGMALGKLADGDGANAPFLSAEELERLLWELNHLQGTERNEENEKESDLDGMLSVYLPASDRL